MSTRNVGYFPGCSGQGTSKEYERSTRAVCSTLGLTLHEIPDWNCCGSTPAHTVDAALAAALSARVFAQAEEAGISHVVTPCPSCLKNLRNCLNHRDDPLFMARVEALTGRPLTSEHSVTSVLQAVVEDVGLESVKARVQRSLKGLRVVPYYGCLMNRPAASMRFDDPENPVAMDRLLEALGAEVLPFPLKVDCCGASFAIPERSVVPRLSGRILDMAQSLGADAVVVACPLCQMNLDLRQKQINARNKTAYAIPVPYFTQLMAYAFGLSDKDQAFAKLAVPMAPAFARMRERAAILEAQDQKASAARAAREKAAGRRSNSPEAPVSEAGQGGRAGKAPAQAHEPAGGGV